MAYLVLGCRVLVGVVFVAAASGKVLDRGAFDRFTASLDGLTWLTPALRRPAAAAVVAVEMAVVALVIVPSTARMGFGLAVLAISVFTVGAGMAVRRGAQVECRCFGSVAPWSRLQYIRNGVLCLVAVFGLAATMFTTAPTPTGPAGSLAAASIAGLAGLVVIRMDDLSYVLGLDRR